MKSNKITHTIAFFIIGLFTFVSSQAQEAKTLFINVPDSLCPLLTKVNREDCIDFLSSKMKAQVENRFGQKSEMTDLSKDYIRMQMTPETTWQMKVLALNDTTNVICTVATACAPACDSSIRFYTTDWKPLTADSFITLPDMPSSAYRAAGGGDGGSSSSIKDSQFVFSPHITVGSGTNMEELEREMRKLFEEFKQEMREEEREQGRVKYAS